MNGECNVYFAVRTEFLIVYIQTTVKGKATPLQAWTGPEVSRRYWLLEFKTIGT
jgi:hypothetical protein